VKFAPLGAKRALAVTALTGALALPLLTGAPPANAAVGDAAGALATTAIDVAAATISNAQNELKDPNTTCQVSVTGDNVVQRVNALVAEVHAEDAIAAVGDCVSHSAGTYTGTVTAFDEVYTATSVTTGTWGSACNAASPGSSIEGVLQPLPAAKVCAYPFPSGALGKYHRAKGILTNSRGQAFVAYSPVWYVNN
jgi:hypothetical protein